MIPDPAQAPLSVSELTRRLKDLVEDAWPGIWLRGEISNLRRQASGHVYFQVKDAGAQLACVCFRGSAARIPFELADGLEVVLGGDLTVYEPQGRVQLVVRSAQEAGVGRLQAAFERLKRKLEAEGLFDPARKRPLPRLPRTVAFITSPTGAALRDFVAILGRSRWPGRLIVLPARVQGAGAAEDLLDMLRRVAASREVELVVIGRGGGSIEDLWPFNEEAVARAVAACPLPIISAVGHEIDFVLTDFAADWRAETPSAAAGRIVAGFQECREQVAELALRLGQGARVGLDRRRHALALAAAHLGRLSPRARLEGQALRVDELETRLGVAVERRVAAFGRSLGLLEARLRRRDPVTRLAVARSRLDDLARRLARAGAGIAPLRAERLVSLAKRLQSADPRLPLQRGYALVRMPGGEIVARKADAPASGALAVEFADGVLEVRVGKAKTPGTRVPGVLPTATNDKPD